MPTSRLYKRWLNTAVAQKWAIILWDGLKYATNEIVAAKKSNIKEIVWNARGVILKRPTGSQAIDI